MRRGRDRPAERRAARAVAHADVEEELGAIEDTAGLKDGSHRARGTRPLSVKAAEKRDHAIEKRREQRRIATAG